MTTKRIIRRIERRRYRHRRTVAGVEVLFNSSPVADRLPGMVRRVRRRLLAVFNGTRPSKTPVRFGVKRIYFYSVRFPAKTPPSWCRKDEVFVNVAARHTCVGDETKRLRVLRQVVTHECVHAMLHAVIPGEIPWWLNEGIASYLTEEWAPVSLELLTLDLAALDRKRTSFWNRPDYCSARYDFSRIAVGCLVRRHGLPAVLDLARDAATMGTAKAFRRRPGMKMDIPTLTKRIHSHAVYSTGTQFDRVVIVAPGRAVILRYRLRDRASAPHAVVRARGDYARRLVAAARNLRLPVYFGRFLCHALWETTPPGECIPERLYKPVAEQFAQALRWEEAWWRIHIPGKKRFPWARGPAEYMKRGLSKQNRN
ncbi:MAG: EscU/YscU/HrcU family type III secretion system export apparatus switch protein [Planctomycetota bacterium]